MIRAAVLVLSCDKYSDLWDGFFYFFFKNFPLNLNIYLANNYKEYFYKDRQIKILNCGEDKNWSNHILNALKLIDEEFLFIILEDIYLIESADKYEISRAFDYVIKNDIQHLKYFAFPLGDIVLDDGYRKYSPGMPYAVSVCGIWNKNYLLNLLLDGETAWDFEINGSYRSKYSNKKFYSPSKPLFKYLNMVEKGSWVLKNVEKAKKLGVNSDLNKRDHRSKFTYNLLNIYFDFIIRYIPYTFRVRLVDYLKKIFISY